MAVSLGMRISGLLVAGAVAVAVTAFTGDGRGAPDSGGGGGAIVTAGPSNGATPPSPMTRQSPAGEASSTALPSSQGHTRTATPSPSNKPLLSPTWLPPGPTSPDADTTPDPSSVYDRLRDPGQCRAALKATPTTSKDPKWRLLHALATACLAIQGEGGNWATASEEYTALTGKADTCKGRAAYAVLGGLLDFHRQHPGTTVQLKSSTGGTPACDYRIAGVDTGADGKALPGDTITIELRDTFFDHAELLRFGSVLIGGRQLAGPPVLRSQTGDTLVLAAVVPPLNGLSESPCGAAVPQRGAGNCATSHNGAADNRTADVVVRYGNTEARLKNALTVVAPAVASSPPPQAPSGPPQGMLPLGPLPAHPTGP